MRNKSFMTMSLMAAAFVLGMSSCSKDDDDEKEVDIATQVVGAYAGNEVMTVMGEDFDRTTTYTFTKTSDMTVDMTIPATDDGGMALPTLMAKNIVLKKSDVYVSALGADVSGSLESYTGTVTNDEGAEKSYTFSNVHVIFNNNYVVVSYTLKYGNMPFAFSGEFTGDKK